MKDRETELMLRLAAGDEAAFEPLVVAVLPRLVGFFRRMGADLALAEDCAQEVLMKVYRVRTRYQARARFTTYLFHIARNHWIDVYRHRKVGPQTVSTDAGGDDDRRSDLPGDSPRADAGARDRELGDALATALAGLAPGQREVFVLSQVEGLRYQEIGDILGIPVGTVKSRVHAAVRALRERLRELGFEP